MDKPLVTIGCFTYNQEDYVHETVQGLLSQTYEPLEIIISDDHSTDRTWEIINEEVDAYTKSGGIHKNIVLNRNEQNLGIALHVQKFFTLVHGELIVENGGDDVSMPNRVEKIVDYWLRYKKKPTVMFNGFYQMSLNGELIDREWWWKISVRNPLGAVATFASLVRDSFPVISEMDAYDDNVYTRRAYAFGDPLYIEDKLVKYRVGSGISTMGQYHHKRQRNAKGMIAAARQNLIDIEYVKDRISENRYNEIREMAYEIIDSYGVEYGHDPFRKFVNYWRTCKRRGDSPLNLNMFVREFLFRGYPHFFDFPRRVFAKAKAMCRK